MQGFGNVGYVAARLLNRAGANVVAVSDISDGSYNPHGLDQTAWKASSWTTATRRASGGDRMTLTRNSWSFRWTSWVPAVAERQITLENADRIRAGLVVEGDGSHDTEADRILHEKGILIVPDVLANAGGVIVSYFEWVQDIQAFFWSEGKVNQRLEQVSLPAPSTRCGTPRRSTERIMRMGLRGRRQPRRRGNPHPRDLSVEHRRHPA